MLMVWLLCEEDYRMQGKHLYTNINSQLNAAIIILLTVSISLRYKAPTILPAGSIVGALYRKL